MKIKDFAELLNGFAFKSSKYMDSGYRIIRITNVQSGYLEDEKPVFYNYDIKLNKYELKENDILVSLTGNVGRCAIVTKNYLPSYLNQRVACIRVNEKKVLPKYLYYRLNSRRFESDCIKSSRGIAQLNMSTEWLKEYFLEIPCIEEQKRIVNIFDKLYSSLMLKKNQLNQYEDLVKSQFLEMFGNILKNDRNWELMSWASVLNIKNGRNQKQVENPNGIYPIYGSGGIMSYADDYICNENAVIIGRKGNINNPILVRTKFWNVDTAFGLEPDINYINVEYLYQYCNMYNFEKLNKTVTIPSLTKTDLLKIMMPIPPIELQNKYANIVNQINNQKSIVHKELKQLEQLKESLMNEFFKSS